jgi:hypothetical protein
MHELDIYYRALKQLRAQTATHDRSHRFTEAVKRAPRASDALCAHRTICHIQEDWVEFIETHLPYVERAIKEERQFIRREGETVDIGKAKKVSRDSVEHLARHSEMITHLPEEDEMLIPDRIYITENTSNYTVYENRFLYFLLTFLCDFVEMRYSKIAELGNTYHATLDTHKTVTMGKRTVELELHFCEKAKSDPYALHAEGKSSMLERVEAIRIITNMLLMTPLMKEVAKAPVISPPITRTNVLRMDNNFKYAVELYDYLAAYEGDGYTIEHKDVQQKPFEDALEGEIDELVAITSYLTYKYGSESGKLLEERYLAEELARQEKAEQQRREKLELLKSRAHESQDSMEAYLLALEEQNQMLVRHADRLRAATEVLQKSVDSEAQKLSAVYYEQCDRRFAEKRESLIASYEQKLAEKDAVIAAGEAQNVQSAEEIKGLRARVHALQHRVGEVPVEDTTTREYIAQLEREYAWFEDMFEKNWKLTKKRIRKRVLWSSEKDKKD